VESSADTEKSRLATYFDKSVPVTSGKPVIIKLLPTDRWLARWQQSIDHWLGLCRCGDLEPLFIEIGCEAGLFSVSALLSTGGLLPSRLAGLIPWRIPCRRPFSLGRHHAVINSCSAVAAEESVGCRELSRDSMSSQRRRWVDAGLVCWFEVGGGAGCWASC